ncbi:MAG: protein translocase subunit SecF, partial [Saprospiraceae bacterium]
IRALIVGFSLVLLFMIFYYAGGGIISIIALLLNLFFIFGALASFGTVLTLPGIAGIILTIGMAVDANVIIFERIREELRAGKTILASISDGFRNSYSAIIDANVTTILVAIVLAYFGMGPIKGFAVVLIIGVLTSLFTAVLIGRMIIDWWMKGKADRSMSFWTGMTQNFLANLTIDWIGKRKIAYSISGLVLIIGFASMFTKKFDLGVDFKGGYSYNIEFDESLGVDAQTLRSGLTEYFGSEPVVKAVDTENTYNVVTSYLINDKSDDAAERAVAKLHEGIVNITGSNVSFGDFKTTDSRTSTHVISSSKIGPTIADDIKNSAFYAGIFALLILFLYIFIRFNKWQYSLGAVAALFHDSMIILGIFSLSWGVLPFSLEINQAFIAALLTVIAYSINDTVVVFDRIREYLGIYTSKSTDEVLNLAINSTFSRTLITSLTTMVMLLPLFIFGGGSIRGFAFAILIGIIVGTYSSIFVATPIVRDLSKELKASQKASASNSFSKAAAKAK